MQKIKKIIFGLIVCAGLGIGGWYAYQYTQSADRILDFSDARDTQFILDIFRRDWYWLTSSEKIDNDLNKSSDTAFSPYYTLQYRASSRNPEHRGNLSIKVGYDDNKPVGFVAYYKKKFYYGYLLFLDVLPEYRAKGWGRKLAEYAINDMKNQGATKIGLVTRTSNIPAQKLYTRLGFKEVARDDGYVDFELIV